ncbi:MAG: cysteine desulfurase family protein [Limnochordales bacterium]
MRTIYMDYAATTPLDPDVLEAMLPWLREGYGNPSSPYAAARLTRAAVDDARVQVAEALDVKPGEVYFTSGGTEALNLAVKGAAFAARKRGRGAHVVVSAVEHQAVLASAAFLERQGFGVTRVPVDEYGVVHPVAVAEALRPDTALVAVMHANNEIGTIQPVEEIARITRARGVPLLVDAVQTAGLLEVRPDDIGCDLLALSAHKLYGPKGVGVLYVRTGTKLEPLLHGGGQERGLRAGTENVAGIVGLAAALKKALDHRPGEAARLAGLRDALIDGIRRRVPGAVLNGHPVRRLPNNVHFSFPGVDGESLLLNLDLAGVAASAGSACTSGSLEPSHVLTAVGLPKELAASGLRLTVGRHTTEEDVAAVVDIVAETIEKLRGRTAAAARLLHGE